MSKISLLIISCIFIFGSCKKDRLEGEKTIFKGKWNWIYSNHSYGWCENQQISDSISEQDVQHSYGFEFMEKGKVRFISDGEKVTSHNLVFREFDEPEEGYCSINNGYEFEIYPDNESSMRIWGCVNSDTIECSSLSFPFETDEGCEVYWSYFVKQ
ncbi:MAG: hypothetical protein WDZ35_10850 [Crocinitomicaceae bacterium]